MEHWKEGKYKILVQDTVKTSLSLLLHVWRQMDDQEVARTYNRMVLQGKPVIDVLKSKHPEARVPDVGDLPHYDETPEFIDVDITADTVESIARKLSGSAGPGGCHDAAGGGGGFTRWMANEMPPWAAYRAMIASRCVALDKCPGVRPVGIGEIWRQLQAKCLLVAAGEEAKDACSIDQ
eukprot:scaffold180161_cov59-Attheya_sp.AAC.1